MAKIFSTPFRPEQKQAAPPEHQLIDAMIASGLTPPSQVFLDGQLHRFDGKKKGGKSCWYVAFCDGVPAGRFGDWSLDLESTFLADIGRDITPVELMKNSQRMAEAKKRRDEEKTKKYEAASITVEGIWSNCSAADDAHPYLQKKGISANGARITGDGRLVVPLYSPNGDISSLQYISHEGSKQYHKGGAVGGKFWQVGAIDDDGPLFIAEGFATAATINKATNSPCVVAYSASNLVPVTEAMREKYGVGKELIIVADNDESGVGLKYADQASAKFGAKVVMPPIKGDANDYAALSGIQELVALLVPEKSSIYDDLRVVSGDSLSPKYQAPDELIEDMLVRNSQCMLYGDSNSGKTFLALSMAHAICEGVRFMGKEVVKGAVIYLATESPASVISRVQAIKDFHKCNMENLYIVQIPVNFFTSDKHATEVIELTRQIESDSGEKVNLIIGDTLARMTAGANENSGEDMVPILQRLDAIVDEADTAFLTIHHSGKDATRGARGSSTIRAHIDTEIMVVEHNSQRTATVTKQRELPSKGTEIPFSLEVIEMGISKFGKTVSTCVAVFDEEERTKVVKKDSKLEKHKKLIERAWWSGGAEVRDINGENKPYFSRSAFSQMLSGDGHTDGVVKNYLKPSYENGPISMLLSSEIITPHQHGFAISDLLLASACLLRKGK